MKYDRKITRDLMDKIKVSYSQTKYFEVLK